MGLSPIYPTENDRQVESKATHDLLTAVDSHLEHVLSLIQANRQKSRLLRAPAARFQPLR
jgi:prephenate dehydrogenase